MIRAATLLGIRPCSAIATSSRSRKKCSSSRRLAPCQQQVKELGEAEPAHHVAGQVVAAYLDPVGNARLIRVNGSSALPICTCRYLRAGRCARQAAVVAGASNLCEHLFVSRASILHADLDSFFASVEQRDDPRLRGRAVIVGMGVVLAASYEAKACGVRTAMGQRRAQRLCPAAVVVPPRMSRVLARRAGRCSACSTTRHPSSRRCRSTRRSSTCRGWSGASAARRDRDAPQAVGARAGRAAGDRRRGADEVLGQGGERRREAGRPARRRARARAGVPAPPPGRAALGCRRRDRGEAASPRHLDRAAGRAPARNGARRAARPRRGPSPARAGAQPRPATGATRPASRVDRIAAGAAPAPWSPAVPTPTCSRWSTA